MKSRLITLALLMLLPINTVRAQIAEEPAAISQEITRLEANASLDESVRTAAISVLNDARQLAIKTQDRANAVTAYLATAASAEQTIRNLRSDIDRLQQFTVPQIPTGATAEELNRLISESSAERAEAAATLAGLRIREAALVGRADEIASEIVQAREDIDKLEDAPPVAVSDNNPLAEANHTLYAARLAERRAAINDLARERTTLAARRDIVTTRIELVNLRIGRLAETIVSYQAYLNTSKALLAKTKLAGAESEAVRLAGGSPGLQTIAAENIALAKQNLDLIEKHTALAGQTSRLQQDLLRVTSSVQTVEQVLATGQLNDQTAELLRDVRRRLPNENILAETTRRNNQVLVALRLNQVLWQDRLRNLSDTQAAALRLLADTRDLSPGGSVIQEAENLVVQRRDLLQNLTATAREKSEQLNEQRALRLNLQTQTHALASLLDRRLLWLRTNNGLGPTFTKNLSGNITWLLSPAGWSDVAESLSDGFATAKLRVLAMLILIVALFGALPVMNRRLRALVVKIEDADDDTYLSTPEALLLSVGITLPWPLFIGLTGWTVMQGATSIFATAISQGIVATAVVIFLLDIFRVLAKNEGVFHRHYGWSKASRKLLKFHLSWFIVVEAIVAFVFTAATASGDSIVKYGIGRLTFMVSAVALAVFAYYFLKPVGGIASSVRPETDASSGMKFLFIAIVAIPLINALLAIIGYFDAAIELQSRVFMTGIVFLLAAVVYGLAMRLFLVGHRRLVAKHEQERSVRDLAQLAADADAGQSGDAAPVTLEVSAVDLDALSVQSRRTMVVITAVGLLTGLWVVWGSLVPALSIANDVILWEGSKRIAGIDVTHGISLWDVSVAMILVVGGFVLARNIRGILELLLFARFNFDSGTRYATTTIAGYFLVGFGITAGFSRLGVDWSSLQWVIAALGVGLGFGLQEIVANFVSGLIILFERPVRVGDIVTIGQLEGTVTSIKIRATRITDFDNREVLLPNKSIITENVTNWTLNDQVTRIILRIGVAYGSDIDKVRGIIMDAVCGHAETLNTPSPAVFFMAHGDSSLDFEARVFVATPSKRLPVTHDLNRSINLSLAKNNIEIPFPQRDLHIRSSDSAPTATDVV